VEALQVAASVARPGRSNNSARLVFKRCVLEVVIFTVFVDRSSRILGSRASARALGPKHQ